MTEQPTSFERPQTGADPTDARGALLRSPTVSGASALPQQSRAAADDTSRPAGAARASGSEHSQSASAESGAHRPRPAPEGIPAQPDAAARAAEATAVGPMTPETRTAETVTTVTAEAESAGGGATGGGTGGGNTDRGAGDGESPGGIASARTGTGPPPASGAPDGQDRRARRGLPPDGKERRTGRGLPPGRPLPMRRDGDRLRFVGAATRRIARGMDLDEIVMGLCRATVPTFSDAILVYLREPLPVGDERPVGPLVLRLRRTDRIPAERDTDGVYVPPPVPEQPAELSVVTNELCEVRPGSALGEVLRGVRPVFTDTAAAQVALAELLGEGSELAVPGGQRAILAPLRGRRRVIGAALFLRRPDRQAFEPEDLLVAAQLATHSALGIDKAVLYGREAYIADELQRTMLPETLPHPTGVRLASRYLPAAETARVGGDWYDAIPLPGNRVALVVGDVMGHSMTSAAIMGQLRTTAQTLAGLDLPPQEVLHHLDEQAQRLGTDRMATCMYAVYDPVAHRITIANAGHPPPVLLHLGGRSEVLRVPSGAPIGVGGVDFEAVELDAPAGATLLLYTDGLVESRLRDVWTGIEQLRERLQATAQLTGPDHPPPLEALCDEVLDMLGPGDRDDDIALLAARFDGIAPSDVAYWSLEPEDSAPGRARRLARQALDRWGLQELTDSVELLVSEVVTNAVRYASRPVTLRLLRTDVLRCEVGDDVPQLPRMRQARATDEGGRGLYLVNKLARRWGATRLSTGKVVWFELNHSAGNDQAR
ncbi:ATP-binding SpoIIE family protein phosphatase [Streptomyces triticisoli]|uniref:ATP-binding SpoIIE family protein phosphatase n=1 Tax=Streptomyces triticisoli TaxID=2182797 RepID=UPI000DD8640A|nr:SpoIIE family protein phosphatase [Streptomyces triticisoli]